MRVVKTSATGMMTIPLDFDTLPFTCIGCKEVYFVEKLKNQIDDHFKREYFRCKLTQEVREKLVDTISPWFNKFISGIDICFECGILENESEAN